MTNPPRDVVACRLVTTDRIDPNTVFITQCMYVDAYVCMRAHCLLYKRFLIHQNGLRKYISSDNEVCMFNRVFD